MLPFSIDALLGNSVPETMLEPHLKMGCMDLPLLEEHQLGSLDDAMEMMNPIRTQIVSPPNKRKQDYEDEATIQPIQTDASPPGMKTNIRITVRFHTTSTFLNHLFITVFVFAVK